MNDKTQFLTGVVQNLRDTQKSTIPGDKKLTKDQIYTLLTASIAVGGAVTGYFLFSHFADSKPQLPNQLANQLVENDLSEDSSSQTVEEDKLPGLEDHGEELSSIDIDNVDYFGEVSDTMPFGAAFSSAREGIGSGGFFAWKGDIYSTFNIEEWNGLSAAQQNAFMKNVFNSDSFQSIKDHLYLEHEEVQYAELDSGAQIDNITPDEIDNIFSDYNEVVEEDATIASDTEIEGQDETIEDEIQELTSDEDTFDLTDFDFEGDPIFDETDEVNLDPLFSDENIENNESINIESEELEPVENSNEISEDLFEDDPLFEENGTVEDDPLFEEEEELDDDFSDPLFD